MMAGSAGESPTLGRVVVGVDGSGGSLQALHWALREAQLRGAPVHAVLAWQFHPSWSDSGLGRMFPTDFGSGIGDASGMPAPLESDDLALGAPESGVRGTSRRIAAEELVSNVLDVAIAEALAGSGDVAGYPGRHAHPGGRRGACREGAARRRDGFGPVGRWLAWTR